MGELRSGVPQPPCRDCADRCVGCHGKNEGGSWRCGAYGAYQAAMDKLRADKRGSMGASDVMRYYLRARSERWSHAKGIRRR